MNAAEVSDVVNEEVLVANLCTCAVAMAINISL